MSLVPLVYKAIAIKEINFNGPRYMGLQQYKDNIDAALQ